MQESLFNDLIISPPKKQKKPKLGRYERLQRELEASQDDVYKRYVSIRPATRAKSVFNFIDLFCGAGGMTLGLSHSGLKPVAAVEMVEIACATHKRNFPSCKLFSGDIRNLSITEWLSRCGSQEIHLVVGGPPCQGFSVAGKRNAHDERNTLFKEFVRTVEAVRPWYFVMENVPGILTMANGKFKEEILNSFSAIGYPNVSVTILETAAYEVPQIRTRAIFIGNRFGLPNPFPSPLCSPSEYKPIESAISDLPAYDPIPEINHEWTKHSKEMVERISKVPPGGSLYDKFVDAWKRQYPGLPSMTIKENHGGTHIHPHLNRVISAREMARLQSFPDRFIFEGSMKKAMWQIGNAVPPRLAECIGYALMPYLNAISERKYEKLVVKKPTTSLLKSG